MTILEHMQKNYNAMTKPTSGAPSAEAPLLAGLLEKQFAVVVDIAGMEETLCFNEEHAKAVVAYALFRGANKIAIFRQQRPANDESSNRPPK